MRGKEAFFKVFLSPQLFSSKIFNEVVTIFSKEKGVLSTFPKKQGWHVKKITAFLWYINKFFEWSFASVDFFLKK